MSFQKLGSCSRCFPCFMMSTGSCCACDNHVGDAVRNQPEECEELVVLERRAAREEAGIEDAAIEWIGAPVAPHYVAMVCEDEPRERAEDLAVRVDRAIVRDRAQLFAQSR